MRAYFEIMLIKSLLSSFDLRIRNRELTILKVILNKSYSIQIAICKNAYRDS